MAYSAGTLPEAFSLMVAAHVSLCDTCRAQLEAFDALGGEMIERAPDNTVAMTPDSLAETMKLIAGGATREIRMGRNPGVFPGPIQDYVGGDLEDVRWRSIGMGVKQCILPTSSDASARLLFIPAGSAMPDHGHYGTEMTMVLKGAFRDEDGYFQRGDVELADATTKHTPVADVHEDCICLAVTDARLRFDGIIPKIAQRIARI